MPRRHPLLPCLGLTLLLAGCLPHSEGKDSAPGDVTANAVAGAAIEVSPLDAAAPSEATGLAVPPLAADPKAKQQSDAPDTTAAVKAEPAPQPDLTEAPPVEEKSDRQIACEKKKGDWVTVEGSSHACVFRTGDAGKSCSRESQCEGACLARSGTCSPIKPLLGCNEILQDDGARVTLCIN